LLSVISFKSNEKSKLKQWLIKINN
jgi:hypothetical protein